MKAPVTSGACTKRDHFLKQTLKGQDPGPQQKHFCFCDNLQFSPPYWRPYWRFNMAVIWGIVLQPPDSVHTILNRIPFQAGRRILMASFRKPLLLWCTMCHVGSSEIRVWCVIREVLNPQHMICCGLKECTASAYTVQGLCSQTSQVWQNPEKPVVQIQEQRNYKAGFMQCLPPFLSFLLMVRVPIVCRGIVADFACVGVFQQLFVFFFFFTAEPECCMQTMHLLLVA